MSKYKKNISIAIPKELDDKLEKGKYNKSKLVSYLIEDWIKSGKKNLNNFKKR